MSIRTAERVVCKLCGREGDVAFRSGYKDGEWLCIHRRPCLSRQRKRDRLKARIASGRTT